ncbi:nicotinamide phosphoribosyl transferase [Vibrio phage Vp_R1]|uniref:Nicotinamide phosphoribosyltransferase n=1 Tax=Vibrio phage Vp_R1 TaxID=2059867 RepID=A0A2H5BPZ7_9CAUD|nr:nicotinamide phosphoribosyl transferase [Vibrio phage Vp_R1]AUG88404.1 nicotinamide phosphoribosyltransferase [Vibrio phage Vp_R1]
MSAISIFDIYKNFHPQAYHPHVTEVYSNFTNRSGKYAPDNKLGGVVNLGLTYFMKDFLIGEFGKFFNTPKKEAIKRHARVISAMLGVEANTERFEELHDIGYLPLEIKQVREGTIVPYGMPSFTIRSTDDRVAWLTNSIETVCSSEIWQIQTSATTAANYKLNILRSAVKTGLHHDLVNWLCHDFSFRGMPGRHAAAASGFGHLTSFWGTDTVPAVFFAEDYYNADVDKELVGGSVNATEHSVTCSWQDEGELEFVKYLMNVAAPTGILSIVADTWDFWNFVMKIIPKLKDDILKRDGKIVIRPDSGDPVEIICGIDARLASDGNYYRKDCFGYYDAYDVSEEVIDGSEPLKEHEVKGLIEVLWDQFGGTVVNGYKHLDDHIGAIYGDSITLQRQKEIIKRLEDKGFAPTVVFGIGSYTYQYVTRDTHGSAVKATNVVKSGVDTPIFKDPVTDPGKKSAKGLLFLGRDSDGEIFFEDNVSREREASEENLLQTVFLNGEIVQDESLSEIRKLIEEQLEKYL